MNQKKKLYGKILLPTALAAALLSLTACGSGDSNNASTIASITNESSAVSTVNGEVPYTFFDDAVFAGDSVSLKLNLYVSAQRKNDNAFNTRKLWYRK